MTIAELIENRIKAAGSPESESSRKLLAAGALPIYFGWSGEIGIRPGGELVFFNEETKKFEDVDPKWRVRALVVGVRRFPELQVLLPTRGSDASDCPECGGRGFASETNPTFGCAKCDGSGWVERLKG